MVGFLAQARDVRKGKTLSFAPLKGGGKEGGTEVRLKDPSFSLSSAGGEKRGKKPVLSFSALQ